MPHYVVDGNKWLSQLHKLKEKTQDKPPTEDPRTTDLAFKQIVRINRLIPEAEAISRCQM